MTTNQERRQRPSSEFYERDLSTLGEAVRFTTELAHYVLATYRTDEPTVTISVDYQGVQLIVNFGGTEEPWDVQVQTGNGDRGSVWHVGDTHWYGLEPDPAIAFGALTTLQHASTASNPPGCSNPVCSSTASP